MNVIDEIFCSGNRDDAALGGEVHDGQDKVDDDHEQRRTT